MERLSSLYIKTQADTIAGMPGWSYIARKTRRCTPDYIGDQAKV